MFSVFSILSRFSMYSQLTPCSPTQDSRMEQFVEPCLHYTLYLYRLYYSKVIYMFHVIEQNECTAFTDEGKQIFLRLQIDLIWSRACDHYVVDRNQHVGVTHVSGDVEYITKFQLKSICWLKKYWKELNSIEDVLKSISWLIDGISPRDGLNSNRQLTPLSTAWSQTLGQMARSFLATFYINLVTKKSNNFAALFISRRSCWMILYPVW